MKCMRCLMDDRIPTIEFSDDGTCSFCHFHDELDYKYDIHNKNTIGVLDELIDKMKFEQQHREYDCVIGVSGGCDSSYLMHVLKTRYNLRMLAVTFDNTWANKIAVENILAMTRALDIDLITNVVDNNEFNDICRSFLYASVPDADIPSDIAITRSYYDAMNKFDVNYYICGHSFRTEGSTPVGWTYMDGKYIESVHKEFGTVELKTFPNLDIDFWLQNMNRNRIRPLYYMDYKKEDAKQLLIDRYGWKWYGGHHMENDYTHFVKNYLLPVKFGIDKRIVEYSALVRSGQIDRNAALKELETMPVVDNDFIEYIKKRLNITDIEFNRIMTLPIKSYKDYKTYKMYFIENRTMFETKMQMGQIPETFYRKYCF